MRYAYLDVLKVIATCFVVIIHTIGFKVVVFENTWEWFMASLFSMSARFAVPVFVMCSGAVFLKKNFETKQDIITFYKKYLPIYFGYLFLGLLVAKGLSIYAGQDIFILKGLLYDFYTSFGSGMWFFFMFIGLIAVVPILSTIVKKRSISACFLSLWFIFCIIRPFLSTTLGIYRPYVSNTLFADFFVGYFILGHFLATTNFHIQKKHLIFIALSSLICANIAAYLHNLHTPNSSFFYYSNNPFIFVYTTCCFLLAKKLLTLNCQSSNFLIRMSNATVFVYIFHTTVQNTVPFGYQLSKDNIYLIMLIRVPVIIFFSYIASFCWMTTWQIIKRKLTGLYQATFEEIFSQLEQRFVASLRNITEKLGRHFIDQTTR